MDMQARSNQEVSGVGSNNNLNWGMRQTMFEKVLTPSDVGKLNRLVIPKQHAETYFPLEENQNGTTLDFQDRNGKTWRFRYSYWNSSQSYVMTKGWSRFIKDKQLHALDTVSFHRSEVPDDNEPGKSRRVMFIDWRHRADLPLGNPHPHPIFGSPAGYYPLMDYSMPHYRSSLPFYDGFGYGGRYYADARTPTSEMRRPPLDHYLGRSDPLVFDSFPVFPAAGAPQPQEEVGTTKRKLRLFGVDLEESSSSGETMGLAGYSLSSPFVIKDDIAQSSWRLPCGQMGASSSSVRQLSDEEEYKRKGKSLEFEH